MKNLNSPTGKFKSFALSNVLFWKQALSLSLCLSLTILFSDKLKSQENGIPSIHLAISAVQQSDFIFEGIVTSQEIYESSSENAFTANTIQITRIFKGKDDISCGEILLLNQGTSGQWVDFGNGYYSQDMGEHVISYAVGKKGIFFTKTNNEYYHEPETNNTNNSVIVRTVFEGSTTFLKYNYDPRCLDYIDLETTNNFAEGFDGLHFGSYEELFNYISSTLQLDSNNFEKCEGVER